MRTFKLLSRVPLMLVTICLLGTFVSCDKSELEEYGRLIKEISNLRSLISENGSVSLLWDEQESANFDHVEIYYGEGSAASDAITRFTGSISNNGAVIENLLSETNYVFWLRNVDTDGNMSEGTIITVRTQDSGNTIDVTNLTAIVRNERIILKWTPLENPSETLMYPIIYFGEGNTAANATELANYADYGDSIGVVSELTNGIEYTFVVKTTDLTTLKDSYGVSVTATPVEMDDILNVDLTYNSFTDTRDGEVYKTIKIGDQTWMAENFRYLPSVFPADNGAGSDEYSRYYVYGYYGSDTSEAKAHTEDLYIVDWNGDGYIYEHGIGKRTISSYETYGVLYNYVAAINSCPPGWHLPTDEEWKTLEMHLGMSASDADKEDDERGGTVAKKLAAQTGWPGSTSKNDNFPEEIGYNFYANNSTGFSALPGGYRQGYYGGFGTLGESGYWWAATKTGAWRALHRELRGAEVIRRTAYTSSGYSVRYVKD